MKKTRHTTPQIIEKRRQADVALGKGQKVAEQALDMEILKEAADPRSRSTGRSIRTRHQTVHEQTAFTDRNA